MSTSTSTSRLARTIASPGESVVVLHDPTLEERGLDEVPLRRLFGERRVAAALLGLRLVAALAQILAAALLVVLGARPLQVAALLGVVLFVLVTTGIVAVALWLRSLAPARVTSAVVLGDTALLAILLAAVGGPENPLAVLFVHHLVLALLVGGTRLLWPTIVVAAAGYAIMNVWHAPLVSKAGEPLLPEGARGIIATMLVAALAVAGLFFVARRVRSFQRELEEHRETAERSARLASITSLAAGAAHELATPIGTIQLAATELEARLAQLPGEREAHADAQLILEQTRRCRELLDDLRVDARRANAIAGPNGPDREEYVAPPANDDGTAAGTVDDLLKSVAASASGRAEVSIEVEPSIGTPSLPMAPLERALTILLGNAVDASDGAPIQVRAVRRGKWVLFEVVDQGPGIAPEVLSRLSEPFVTTKGCGQGRGLGLFIVRAIASGLGAELVVRTSNGRGTTVTLALRAIDADGEAYR